MPHMRKKTENAFRGVSMYVADVYSRYAAFCNRTLNDGCRAENGLPYPSGLIVANYQGFSRVGSNFAGRVGQLTRPDPLEFRDAPDPSRHIRISRRPDPT